jgi:hypothetical protein
MGVDPNLKSPFVANYNLSIQHSFGPNLSLEVGYVGNHGYRLLNFADLNQAPVGAGYCLNSPLTAAQLADACSDGLTGTNAQAAQEARPFYTKFPYVGFINYVTNRSHSRYNSFQATLTKRMSHGLSFTTGYTYSHGLDNGSLNRFGSLPQDSSPAGINREYASSDFDIRHRLTFTATYNIPGIKGFAQLLEGWQINTIVNYQTAQPWNSWDGVKPGPPGNNFTGDFENSNYWNINGPASSIKSGKSSVPFCTGFDGTLSTTTNTSATVGCTVVSVYGGVTTRATSAQIAGCLNPTFTSGPTVAAGGCVASLDGKTFLTPPALGKYGNMGRNIFRDSGFKNWDMSLFKNFTFKERYGVQFRVEGFNILNHPTAANPSGASSFVNAGNGLQGGPGYGASLATADFAAGNPLIGSGSQRVVQLGLKLTF